MTRLIRTAAVLLATVAGLSVNNAQAAVTSVFFSNNASCTGPNTQTFTPGGAAVQMSLCMNATTATCGHTVVLQAAAAGESGRFVVTGLTLGGSFPDPNATTPPLPLAINNPPVSPPVDLGGTSNGTVAAGNNRLLATFTLAPQANATNNSYTIGLNGVSIVAEDLDGTCGATTVPAEITMNTVPTGAPTMVLNRQPAPAFTSPAAVTFTTTASNTFTVTATGSPAPTIALTTGTLPAGVTFTPATGVLAGTPSVTGTFNLTFTASNGVTPNAVQSFVLTVGGQASQTISFTNPGTQSFSATPIPLTATATSGLPVTFSSNTPFVCSVSGSNVTMITTGTCTVNANQAGNATYLAAPQVSQSFGITPTVPGAPTIGTATAGNGQATVSFTTPASTGGSSITSYTATCGGVSTSGSSSPIVVAGLVNDVQVTCTVTATNSVGTSAASAGVNVTPTASAPFTLVDVVSRKTHGASGVFNHPIATGVAIGGAVTVEPRTIGAGHTVVFRFSNPVTSVGGVTVVDSSMANVGSAMTSFTGSEVVVTLTAAAGVYDNKRVTITLTNVNGSLSPSVSMGFLVGDVNNTRSVTGADILQVKGRSGFTSVDATSFIYDLNATGTITSTDILLVKGFSGQSLAP